MAAEEDTLLDRWEQASVDLDFSISAPFHLILKKAPEVRAILLVQMFGARNGMLIVDGYDLLKGRLEEITGAGYGFSVMSPPRKGEAYVRADFVALLREWGWSGPELHEPRWLQMEQLE